MNAKTYLDRVPPNSTGTGQFASVRAGEAGSAVWSLVSDLLEEQAAPQPWEEWRRPAIPSSVEGVRSIAAPLGLDEPLLEALADIVRLYNELFLHSANLSENGYTDYAKACRTVIKQLLPA